MERVETGGLMSFDYSKSGKPKMKDEERVEIEGAYQKYYERKKKEKRTRLFIIILIIILLIVGLGFLIYRL